jgi:hypothetical protein
MGAYIVWYPRARVMSLIPIVFFIGLLELPAALVLGIWFVMQFFTSPDSAVAWQAHVGGFVAGALVALAVTAIAGPPKAPPSRGPALWSRRPWGRRGGWDDGWDGGFRAPDG